MIVTVPTLPVILGVVKLEPNIEGFIDKEFILVAVKLLASDITTKPSPTSLRSEERRVGKECRSRWSPYH